MQTLFSFFIVLFSLTSFGQQGPLDIGAQAPDLRNLGLSYSSSRPTVVAFWATWCVPCKASIPLLNNIFQSHLAQVVGVALEREGSSQLNQQILNKFMADADAIRPTYPIVLDQFGGGPLEAQLLKAADGFSIPTVMVVSKTGRLAYVGDSHDNSFLHILDAISSGRWDYEKARRAYRTIRRQNIFNNNMYQISNDLRSAVQLQTPEDGYRFLNAAIERQPRLLDYLSYFRIQIALNAQFQEVASQQIKDLAESWKTTPHILIYLLGMIDKVNGELAPSLKDAKIKLAEYLYLATEGSSRDALAILKTAGFEQACDGNKCLIFPVETALEPKARSCRELF